MNMAKRYGCYSEDMINAAKETLFGEIRKALNEFNPAEDNAYGVVAAIGGMIIMTDSFINELKTERDDDR